MSSDFKELVDAGARELGLTLSPQALERLTTHQELLARWNRRINLTTITEPQEVAQKHFIDSLALVSLPEQGERLLDLGSGAGFPGLVLAIVRDDLAVFLSESHNKKRVFLQTAIRELGLTNAKVLGRSTDHEDDQALAHSFDWVVARALGDLVKIARLAGPFLKANGTILAQKGPKGREELDQQAADLDQLGFAAEILAEKPLPGDWRQRMIIRLSPITRH